MVWFQCEDCGENLKKPKLLSHFNRCSAYKLSCIDCGVVFDQQSVQAHTSCVTEVEKYGPKGLTKGAGVAAASKAKNGKEQTGPDIYNNLGLSICPPWSCSLCNVKATSRETLEIHAQGKKHRSRAKAAAKESIAAQDEASDIAVDSTIGASNDESKTVAQEQVKNIPGQSMEKKRKKEHLDDTGDLISQQTKSGKLEKKLKRDRTAGDCTPSDTDEVEGASEEAEDSQETKRNHLNEQGNPTGEDQKVTAKKNRKREKLLTPEKGHDELDTNKVVESLGKGGKVENPENLKKKEKKGLRMEELSSLTDSLTTETKGQNATNGNGVPLHDLSLKSKNGDPIVNKKSDSGKKHKKDKVLAGVLTDSLALENCEKLDEDSSKSSKKEKSRKVEKKEIIAHEVSFREWLGEEDDGQEDTPTHPPSHDMALGIDKVQQLEGVEKTRDTLHKLWEDSATVATQEEIAKIVKWKKLIKDILRKSVNGRMKKKDLKKVLLPLAILAAESSAISVDKKSLKAELMRQVSSSPKFVVDGKHVMLAVKVKLKSKAFGFVKL